MIRTRPRYLSTGKVPVVVKRTGEGSWVGGRYVKGSTVELTIEANVQPMPRGIDTRLRPHGDNTREAFMVFSNEEIRQLREGNGGWEADTIVWEGKELEVMEVAKYAMGVLDHYEAYCFRKEVT